MVLAALRVTYFRRLSSFHSFWFVEEDGGKVIQSIHSHVYQLFINLIFISFFGSKKWFKSKSYSWQVASGMARCYAEELLWRWDRKNKIKAKLQVLPIARTCTGGGSRPSVLGGEWWRWAGLGRRWPGIKGSKISWTTSIQNVELQVIHGIFDE